MFKNKKIDIKFRYSFNSFHFFFLCLNFVVLFVMRIVYFSVYFCYKMCWSLSQRVKQPITQFALSWFCCGLRGF